MTLEIQSIYSLVADRAKQNFASHKWKILTPGAIALAAAVAALVLGSNPFGWALLAVSAVMVTIALYNLLKEPKQVNNLSDWTWEAVPQPAAPPTPQPAAPAPVSTPLPPAQRPLTRRPAPRRQKKPVRTGYQEDAQPTFYPEPPRPGIGAKVKNVVVGVARAAWNHKVALSGLAGYTAYAYLTGDTGIPWAISFAQTLVHTSSAAAAPEELPIAATLTNWLQSLTQISLTFAAGVFLNARGRAP